MVDALGPLACVRTPHTLGVHMKNFLGMVPLRVLTERVLNMMGL